MTDVADVISGRRFAPDPLAPGRERWWDGWHWTARVRDAGAVEGIHWIPDLADLPKAVALDAPTDPVLSFAPVPPAVTDDAWVAHLTDAPVEPDAPRPLDLASDPMTAAFGDDLRPFVPEANVPGSRRRRIVTAVEAVAAAALIAVAAAGGAGVFTSSDQRPSLAPQLAYRDTDAGFALRYPDDWRVLRKDRGSSIRFAIASPRAPASETNTVSVVVGASAADLPALHSLADQLTEMLRQQLPGVELESAARTRVAGAPGFRFGFRDPDSSPATRIEQFVGRTSNGRPLTVTVTVREPRTAPTHTELNDFLDSLRSGNLETRD